MAKNWLDDIVDLQLPRLAPGAHEEGSGSLCLMELVSFMEREPHSDHPMCVDEVITHFGICLNDSIPDHRRNELMRLAPMMVGSVDESDRIPMLSMEEASVPQMIKQTVELNPFTMLHEIASPAKLRGQMLYDLADRWARRYPIRPQREPVGVDHMMKLSQLQGFIIEGRPGIRYQDTSSFIGNMIRYCHAQCGHSHSQYTDRLVDEAIMVLELMVKAGPHTPEPKDNWTGNIARERITEWKELATA